ncbi:Permease YjgP/YjgQ family protein [uncultured Paludibacter sp.]|uniref:Permease YjgP/YjgQ family protein n=1 Tax=uncultured Paludibacter sp. TaxID=497635 RepID=A0A653AFY4_9BACT|nr:Permease YjgP/YjgQ family protein [uncultured Paludibacter sp.]
MFKIKKLDIYILKSFLTYFFMTFFIVMLILLMQFTWKHLNELIGKGVAWSVIGEFFVYASLTLVPMALPLAILLAALMSFGNFGENFELTAMKSAGVSLFRIMRGLIVFISFICVAAFFFSNNVLPISQTKLWALVFSLRQKSPEFDIPVGEFYSGINGVNLYVREKDPNKKLLKNLMIYDFSNGFDNATVMVADSGRVQFTADNKYLKLTLYNGESFENLRQQNFSNRANSVPYRRETFKLKEMLIDFDTEFNRYDESVLKDQHVSKNVLQLTQTIDSVSKVVKSRGNEQAKEIINTQYLGGRNSIGNITLAKTNNNKKTKDPDSLFLSLDQAKMRDAVITARQNAQIMKDKIEYNKLMLDEPTIYMRRHQVEWHRKFTLSFACLIFFFIGAPLGAIIRKGGLGMPVVTSVLMFIVYYIIDTTGWKMAREGFWQAYQGMWLSSAVLLPFGLFLTYKAVTDASLFRVEQYEKIFDKMKLFFKNLCKGKIDFTLFKI